MKTVIFICMVLVGISPTIMPAQEAIAPNPNPTRPQPPAAVSPTPPTQSVTEAKPAAALPGKTESQQQPKLEVNEASFLSDAAQEGMLSMEVANLAKEKGAKPSTRNFAERIQKDHHRSQEELLKLMSKKGMVPPKGLTEKQKEEMARMGRLSGDQLDQAFLEQVMSHHAQSIPQFEGIAKTGNDLEVQAFARSALPSLREHFRLARELSPGKVLREGAGAETVPAPDVAKPSTPPEKEKVDPPSNIDKPNTPDVKQDSAPAQKPLPGAPSGASSGANGKK